MVIYSLEVTQFKEITLVQSQPQGADPVAVRTVLRERGAMGYTFSPGRFDCTLFFWAGTSKCVLWPFTVTFKIIHKYLRHSKCATSIFLYYVKMEDFLLLRCDGKVRTANLPVTCQLIFLASLSCKGTCPSATGAEAPALFPAPLWSHWVTLFKLYGFPVPRTLLRRRDNNFQLLCKCILFAAVESHYPGFGHCKSYQLPAPAGTAGWAWAHVWALTQISSLLLFWSSSLGVRSLGIFLVCVSLSAAQLPLKVNLPVQLD